MTTLLLLYWKQLAAFAVAVALLGAVYGFGYRTASNHYERKIAEEQLRTAMEKADAEQQRKEAMDALEQAAMASAKLGAEEARRDTVIANEVNRRVRRYAKDNAAGQCDLPTQFVFDHNAAARGEGGVPETSAVFDARPSGVTDTELLGTVADNYATYRQCAQQVREWQRLYGGTK